MILDHARGWPSITKSKGAMDAIPDSSSLGNFLTYIQNTDPGSNAGIPGLQIPLALGSQVNYQ